MASGWIESDLARVTTAKIGSHRDPRYSAERLLARLRVYSKILRLPLFDYRDSSLLSRVAFAIDALENDVSDGTLRIQPYCIMLYGYPGTGKSSLAIQIARALMTDRYGAFGSRDMVTLNETDEYQSEFRSSHKVVLFDDIGASRYGLADTKNPWRKVIDFVNNIKKTALNPNVEMKGRVYIHPDVVILTSNLDFSLGGAINQYIPAAEAIFRRMNLILRVNNHSTVSRLLPIGEKTKSTHGYMTHSQDYRIEKHGKEEVVVPRIDILEELRHDFRSHMASQEDFVHQFNSCFDDYEQAPVLKAEALVVSQKAPCALPERREVLISQSGSPAEEQVREATISYYVDNVDWKKFCLQYPEGIEAGHTHYVLLDNGTIRPALGYEPQFLIVCEELVNVAFSQVYPGWLSLPKQSLPTQHLRAEAMTSPWGAVRQFLDPPVLSLESVLVQLPEKGKLWDAIPEVFIKLCGKDTTKTSVKTKLNVLYALFLMDVTLTSSEASRVYALYSSPKLAKKLRHEYLQMNARINRGSLDYLKVIDQDALSSLENEILEVQSISSLEESVASEIVTSSPPTSSDSVCSLFPCEEVQIRQLLKLVPREPCWPVFSNLAFGTFGEVDLVVEGPNSLLVFECKSSVSSMGKARAQAVRYTRVMQSLREDKRVTGLVYSPYGIRVVVDSQPSLPTDFRGFLTAVGYLEDDQD